MICNFIGSAAVIPDQCSEIQKEEEKKNKKNNDQVGVCVVVTRITQGPADFSAELLEARLHQDHI